MASVSVAVTKAGQTLGLASHPREDTWLGEVNNCVVQLTATRSDTGEIARIVVVFGSAGEDDLVLRSVTGDARLATLGIKAKDLTLDRGHLTFDRATGFLGLKPEKLVEDVRTLVNLVTRSLGRPSEVCSQCGSEPARAALVDGLAWRICDKCVALLVDDSAAKRAAYLAQPISYPVTVLVAFVTSVIGAVAWAGIAIFTGYSFGLLGIGIGVMVGLTTARAAGRGSPVVQVVGIVATLLSVVLGQVLFIAHNVHQIATVEAGEVDWLHFAATAPGLLLKTWQDNLLFPLACGFFGAVYAATRTANTPPGAEVLR